MVRPDNTVSPAPQSSASLKIIVIIEEVSSKGKK